MRSDCQRRGQRKQLRTAPSEPAPWRSERASASQSDIIQHRQSRSSVSNEGRAASRSGSAVKLTPSDDAPPWAKQFHAEKLKLASFIAERQVDQDRVPKTPTKSPSPAPDADSEFDRIESELRSSRTRVRSNRSSLPISQTPRQIPYVVGSSRVYLPARTQVYERRRS